MTAIGILEEISVQKRGKTYLYRSYLKLLEEGAEPL
jgi:isocitrate dehydrogenase kinase/phosphatase